MGIGNAKPETSPAHRCVTHPDRFAAVETRAGGKCWECYLGPEKFALRFPPDFYDPSLEPALKQNSDRPYGGNAGGYATLNFSHNP